MVKLAVRIDSAVALRNVCGGEVPDLVELAAACAKGGAKAVAILVAPNAVWNEEDLFDLKKNAKIPVIAEVSPQMEAIKALVKLAPKVVCLRPASSAEQTLEGGLALNGPAGRDVGKAIQMIKKQSAKITLCLDPKADLIRQAKRLGVDGVCLSTSRYARMTSRTKREEILEDLNVGGLLVRELGLELHAGGGLDYDNMGKIAEIGGLSLVVAGSSVMARAMLVGLSSAVEEIREIIEDSSVGSSAVIS